MRPLRIALWLAVFVALFALGAAMIGFLPAKRTGTAAVAPGAPLGGAFQLVDNRGAPVSEAIFRGKPSVTLFGYTHCPDICPTGLMQMTDWAEKLGADADRLSFIFVTVDPERDTPEVMDEYVSAFSPRIIGISGPPEKVHAMVKDYHIYYRKVPADDGDYTMDHAASMVLQDADGDFVGTIAPSESAEAGLAKLRRLVAG